MKKDTKLDRLAKGVAFSDNGSVFKKFEYLKELESLVKNKEDEDRVFDTIKRVSNILTKGEVESSKIKESYFETKSEKELYEFLSKFKNKDLSGKNILSLSDLLEKFFEETMVNVDDEKVRNNRLSLLKELNEVLNRVLRLE